MLYSMNVHGTTMGRHTAYCRSKNQRNARAAEYHERMSASFLIFSSGAGVESFNAILLPHIFEMHRTCCQLLFWHSYEIQNSPFTSQVPFLYVKTSPLQRTANRFDGIVLIITQNATMLIALIITQGKLPQETICSGRNPQSVLNIMHC